MADIAIMKLCKPTTTPNFYFTLSFVWQQSPRASFAPKIIIKNYTFSSSIFNPKKDLKIKTLHLQQFLRLYLDIYVEFFSLSLRWTCLSHFLIETGIAFLNLARLCWIIQLNTAGPASPTSEIFRKHRPLYRDYKGLHGLIRVTVDTWVTTLGYKVTRLNKVYLCVYRVYVWVYMGV